MNSAKALRASMAHVALPALPALLALLLVQCDSAGTDGTSPTTPAKTCDSAAGNLLYAARKFQLIADSYLLKPGTEIRLSIQPGDKVVEAVWAATGKAQPSASGPAEAVLTAPADAGTEVDVRVRINPSRCDSATLTARLFFLPEGPYLIPGPAGQQTGMVKVPGGPIQQTSAGLADKTFQSGSPQVAVSSFWMDGTEITQGEFRGLMKTNPSYHVGDGLPVENVTWAMAADFCNRRSLRDGLQPVYDSATRAPDHSRNGYRLPTSMEWERATQWGFDSALCVATADRWTPPSLITEPSGALAPDRNGIRGLLSNVGEWTDDWYSELPSGAFLLNPTRVKDKEDARVVRGYRASYASTCEEGLLWIQSRLSPDSARPDLGFRTVLAPLPVASRPPTVALKIDTLYAVNDTIKVRAEIRSQSAIVSYALEAGVLGGSRPLSGPDTAFIASAAFAGSFDLVFTVVDSLGRTGVDTAHIRVRSSPPQAFSGPRACHAPVDGILHLAGRAQDNGHIVKYEWNIGPGGTFVAVPGGDTALAATGRLGDSTRYILRATDNNGETDLDTTWAIWVKKWEVVHKRAPFPAREGHQVLVFAGRMWVMGGRDALGAMSDVWSSADGVTWEEATSQAAFGTRFGHAAVVFDQKMWVIGGAPGPDWNGELADVWHSTDGKTWTSAPKPAFDGRTEFAAAAYAGKIWIVGGLRGFYHANAEVWNSPDGFTWTRVFSADHQSQVSRYGHSMGVFRDEMVVMGGTPIGSQAIGPIRTRGDDWAAYTPVIADWKSLLFPSAFIADGDSAWAILGGYLAAPRMDAKGFVANSIFFADSFDAERVEPTYVPAYSPAMVRFQGKLWMIGGNIRGEYRDRANMTDIGDVMYWKE